VFEHFKLPEKRTEPEENEKEESEKEEETKKGDLKGFNFVQANYETLPEGTNVDNLKLSKKKLKQLKRMKVSELKQIVKRPDVVEVWDVTANDPMFLIWLKSYRNSVPVPKHWAQKRKYLQYKRGIPKPPFQLPDFIEATGITRLRNVVGHDPGRNVRQKIRERMNPKLGKMEIDYQVLHDAFFKYQKKPNLTIHGDIYFEGKEYEIKMRKFKPGKVSPELRAALGIPDTSPPPWIINMQRYGPPPSYPNLKIPGVNVPIPESISWGKLFCDEKGYTVYADCQGLTRLPTERTPILTTHWGELKHEEEEEEEYAREQERPEEEEEKVLTTTLPRADFRSGIASVISGLETPQADIRKPMPADEGKSSYQVLERFEKPTSGGKLLEPSYGYKMPGENADKSGMKTTGKNGDEKKKSDEDKQKKPDFTF